MGGHRSQEHHSESFGAEHALKEMIVLHAYSGKMLTAHLSKEWSGFGVSSIEKGSAIQWVTIHERIGTTMNGTKNSDCESAADAGESKSLAARMRPILEQGEGILEDVLRCGIGPETVTTAGDERGGECDVDSAAHARSVRVRPPDE